MTAIETCDVFLCVTPVSEPRGPSSGWYDTRESVLVRLRDRDGRAGWGEAGLRPGVPAVTRHACASGPGQHYGLAGTGGSAEARTAIGSCPARRAVGVALVLLVVGEPG